MPEREFATVVRNEAGGNLVTTLRKARQAGRDADACIGIVSANGPQSSDGIAKFLSGSGIRTYPITWLTQGIMNYALDFKKTTTLNMQADKPKRAAAKKRKASAKSPLGRAPDRAHDLRGRRSEG